MPGLTPDLYHRCRAVLLHCDEFNSYRSLRAVLVTDQLIPFRMGLPSADSPAEQVDRCLAHLIDKRLSNGRAVLPIFLATLRDRYELGDCLRDDLGHLAAEVEAALSTPGPPPVAHEPAPPAHGVAMPFPPGDVSSPVEPPAAGETVTWLHLSDLHFRATRHDVWDANVVLRALLEDVQAQADRGTLQPDAILVSGDIAFSGAPAEYALACDFFDRLLDVAGVPRDGLLVVPGNHDVDRSLISRGAQAICDSLTDREATNAVLFTPADRQAVLRRFQGYRAFVHNYFGGAPPFDDENYFYVHLLTLERQPIAVLGLNSAWTCASDDDRAKGVLIGEPQVRRALDLADQAGATLKIALLHHPFEWLRAFDKSDSAALLLDRCDLVLHGHLHEVTITQLVNPDSSAVIIGSGSGYETRRKANRYNWVRLDPAAGTGSVFLRCYSDERGGFWAKDTLTYRNAPDGVYTFDLQNRSSHSPV